jgi:CheY-like chemotaxis protein
VPRRNLVENALEAARRAGALTSRLLAFSRQQPLSPVVLDINRVTREMSELLRQSLGEQVMLETVLSGGLWPAHVDRSQLESAILNLAVNARDAMGERGGRLTIETGNTYLDEAYARLHPEVAPGQYVMIAVTDTGAGMSQDTMAKAFDPFFTTKPLGQGTGLGLSQVHGFVKQSGGHLKLYSELGVGTSVKIYLPRNTDSLVPLEELARRRATGRRAPCVVLLVEDEEGVRTFVAEALCELGCEPVKAAGGEEALALLAARKDIKLLLTDVVMPHMNGSDLVARALEMRSDLKILYMTGYTRNAIVHNGVLDAGVKLLSKPFTTDQLDDALEAALR